jgi:hypothetical protein
MGGAAPVTTGDAGPGTPRPTGTATRPVGGTRVRAGRRERQRSAYKPSFLERYRTPLFVLATIVGVVLIGGFVFVSASSPAYACTQEWVPTPTAAPTAGATPALGYVQPDMGQRHVPVGEKVTYTYCPPASGMHYNRAGAGPIQPRVYGPSDAVIPQGWIHNLEHGALVVLYTGTSEGATPEGQTALKAFYDAFPKSPLCGFDKGAIGPVIARFDQMATQYAAIVWGRVLPLDKFEPAEILAFWNQWGERTNPEPQCARPSASPAPGSSASPAPSSSAAPSTSAAPSSVASPTPVASPTAVPSTTAPGTSASPAPSSS